MTNWTDEEDRELVAFVNEQYNTGNTKHSAFIRFGELHSRTTTAVRLRYTMLSKAQSQQSQEHARSTASEELLKTVLSFVEDNGFSVPQNRFYWTPEEAITAISQLIPHIDTSRYSEDEIRDVNRKLEARIQELQKELEAKQPELQKAKAEYLEIEKLHQELIGGMFQMVSAFRNTPEAVSP